MKTVRLDEKKAQALKIRAAERKTTIEALVNKAVDVYLWSLEKGPGEKTAISERK